MAPGPYHGRRAVSSGFSCTLGQVISRRAQSTLLLVAPLSLSLSCGGGGTSTAPTPAPSATPTPYAGPPNIVLILADDMGYGDLSSFGSTTIKTPNIDRIASEGVRLTGLTVPAAICAASRAGLMTGRYPVRVGIPWNPPVRLRDGELTVADLLRTRGYATGILGKWHLGWESEDMPTHHGFDFFFGTPSGDERQFWSGDQPTNDGTSEELLTERYTQDGIKWMQSVKDRPFFLYLAYHAPHEPLAASPAFLGKSAGGLYGDVVEELDSGVGQVLKAIVDLGLDQKTLVVFVSDNGPTRAKGETGGSSGPFSGGKGSCLEGGLRVPAMVALAGAHLTGPDHRRQHQHPRPPSHVRGPGRRRAPHRPPLLGSRPHRFADRRAEPPARPGGRRGA